MKEDVLIEVQTREALGKNANRRLRATGQVPAVLYGGGREPVAITVDRKKVRELLKAGGGEHAIFLLKRTGSDQQRHAMIRDMQVNPQTNELLHLDFQRVEMDQEIRVQLAIHLVGTAYGVKTEGGIVDFVTREIDIVCLPKDLPEGIDLDITALRIGEHIEASQLILPAGVKLADEGDDRVIVSCSYSRTESHEAEEATEAPEVIKKGKKETA